MTRFSERQGYSPADVEIVVRQGAPEEMRGVVVDVAYETGLGPHAMRSLTCRTLRRREDPNNWSAYPNVDGEVRYHLDSCDWYEVYDIIEAIYERLNDSPTGLRGGQEASYFADEINKYFRRRGIGWQIADGIVETRGTESFERALNDARSELATSGRKTASNEIHQAISDLSRRPIPDITGAIQHALTALECVARDVTGDNRSTLGTILSRNSQLVPPPLDVALEKLWGFASEQGRHLREGRAPNYDEAELAVQIAAVVSRYLSRKVMPSTLNS
jgi:hypothetical protein